MPRKRVVEQTLYRFDELSDRAKDVVRERLTANDDWWYEYTVEDFTKVLECFGFELRVHGTGNNQRPSVYWQSNPWYAGFCADFSLLDAAACEKKIADHIGAPDPEPDILHRLAAVLAADIARFAVVGMQHIIESGDFKVYVRGDEDGISEVEEYDPDGVQSWTPEQLEALAGLNTTIEATAKDLARWLANQLENEDDYRRSDDAIREGCDCNDMEFYEDGEEADKEVTEVSHAS